MGARFRSWWQQIKQHRVAIGVTAIILLVITTFIFAGYWFHWPWTGFFKRTLWDWLQLLIVPLVLAIIALVFQLANSRTERQLAKQRYEQDKEIAEQRYKQDQQIALDRQREDLLQAYLDRMSELLLKEKLRSSKVDAEVRNVARVRTITILFQLDARRIGFVFAFLREAGLMSTTSNSSVVSLKGADFRVVKWGQADLYGADLRGANLIGANLIGANLGRADLSNANLSNANLGNANLIGANLGRADLSNANLSNANLSNANLGNANLGNANLSAAELIIADLSKALLSKADLRGADLRGADLNLANLSGAYLGGADLSGADLSGADLSGADLSGAKGTTTEQLDKAKSLQGATMPDGTKHD